MLLSGSTPIFLEIDMATYLQYSCLKNPMNRRTWRALVNGITKSQTWLNNNSNHYLLCVWPLALVGELNLKKEWVVSSCKVYWHLLSFGEVGTEIEGLEPEPCMSLDFCYAQWSTTPYKSLGWVLRYWSQSPEGWILAYSISSVCSPHSQQWHHWPRGGNAGARGAE